MRIVLDQRFERHPNMVSAEIGGEAVMMSIEQGAYFGLNPLATRIWALLATPQTGAEMIEVLLDEYDVSRNVLMIDMQKFMLDMLARDLVQQV
jgi:hypothetical protein